MIIYVSCTVYIYCVVQTYRIPSIQRLLFDIDCDLPTSCSSSLYLYILVLYFNTLIFRRLYPNLPIQYLWMLGNDHVQLWVFFRTKLCLQIWWKQTHLNETKIINLILQSSIKHFCTRCRKKPNYLIFVLPENIVLVGRDCSWINTTGCVTSGAGTAYPFGVHELTPGF